MIPNAIIAGQKLLIGIILISLASSVLFIAVLLINAAALLIWNFTPSLVVRDLFTLIQIGLPFNISEVFLVLNTAILSYFILKFSIIGWYAATNSLRD